MRNREDIKEILGYLQTTEAKSLSFDEEAIVGVYQKNDDTQSLPIKILSAFGGLLATLAFFGFVLIAGLYDAASGLVVFGLICVAGGIWMNKEYDKVILDTISVSFYVVGLGLIGAGFIQLEMSEDVVCMILILMAFVSLRIVQNYILSFISVLIINGSMLTLIISNDAYNLLHFHISALAWIVTYLFLEEAKFITGGKILSKLYSPVRTGLIFSFLLSLICVGKRGLLPIATDYFWVSSVIISSAIVYLVSFLLDSLNVGGTRERYTLYVCTILILLPTAFSPAIPGALLVILLSFFVNHKTGLAAGIIAFVYFICQYYYDLNFTLLTKSILLFSSGILLIVLYLFIHKKLSSDEKI